MALHHLAAELDLIFKSNNVDQKIGTAEIESLPQRTSPRLLPIWLGLLGAIGLGSLVLLAFPNLSTTTQTIVSLLSIWVSFAVAYLIFRRDASEALLSFQRVKNKRPIKTFIAGIFLGFSLQLLLVLVGLLIIISFGFDPTQVSNLQTLPVGESPVGDQTWLSLGFILLGAAVIAPIMEELFFRGVVLPITAARIGPVMGVAISALAFGLMHVQPSYESSIYMVLLTTIAGAVFGFMRLRSGSLLLPMAAHIGFNSWALLITLFAASLM
jgi:membrane protease YdiL (CAAX protease family)